MTSTFGCRNVLAQLELLIPLVHCRTVRASSPFGVFACGVFAIVVAANCSPASPTTSPHRFAGVWSGSHQFVSCSGFWDLRACGRLPAAGNVLLVAEESADHRISGTVTIEVPDPLSGATPFLIPASIPVTGTMAATGEMRLEGSTRLRQGESLPCPGDISVTLTDWSNTFAGATVSGRLSLTVRGFNGFCNLPQTIQLSSTLKSVTP
jgi:hypothetical protein